VLERTGTEDERHGGLGIERRAEQLSASRGDNRSPEGEGDRRGGGCVVARF